MPFYRKPAGYVAKPTAKRVYKKPTVKKTEYRKAPTEHKGATAKNMLITRIPLMTRASKRVTIPYYEYQLARTRTAGASTSYFFSANGVFDPNVTGTGHQPMGFDTMMLYYEQYVVMSSKITVTFVNNGANAVRAGVALTPDTTALVIGDAVENGLIKFVALDSAGYSTGAGTGTRIKEVSLDCNCASYFSRKTQEEMVNDTTLVGTAAANPTEQVYFCVTTWGGFFPDNTAVNLDVVLEYDVVFWEPRKLSQQ